MNNSSKIVEFKGGKVEILSMRIARARLMFRILRLRAAQPVFWLGCVIAGQSYRESGAAE